MPRRKHFNFQREADWLEARKSDVTSTEAAALFGLSPYLTHFELWHRKAGNYSEELKEDDRIRWGKRLEPVIARGVADDNGWRIRAMNRYVRYEGLKMGSSFDFEIIAHDKGPGILEVKNVDYSEFRDKWTVHEDGFIEAPAHIELQLQHQLHVIGRSWGVIVVLVGGNSPKLLIRAYDAEVGRAIEAKVLAFWKTVWADQPPTPEYERDAELIMRLNQNSNPDRVFEAEEGDSLDQLLHEYRQEDRLAKQHEAKAKAVKAQIIEQVGDASRIVAPSYTVSAGTQKDTPPTTVTVTEEMVGQQLTLKQGKRGHRMFRMKEVKK